MAEDKNIQQQMQRVEELVQAIDTWADPNLRGKALELVQTLMDFHGAGLDRMMEITANTGAAGYAVFDDFARDDLVSNLLLLYGLHPFDLETRIKQALDKVRPSLNLHEGNVELLGINDGIVRLRLQGNCEGCPSSAMTLKHTIEEAVYAAAPDITAIEVEGVVTSVVSPDSAPSNGFVQIGKLNGNRFTDCEFPVIT
jgi:Fe-S cluster biogenesis protein NfuA